MENTLENKTKFFAQYINQEVLLTNSGKTCLTFLFLDEDEVYKNCLELKPISKKDEWESRNHLEVFDYFRLKGYAIPWMGLSVETLIEFGWIKIK